MMNDHSSTVKKAGDLAARVKAGDRQALAKAITLIESNRPGDLPVAAELLQNLQHSQKAAIRIGLSGAPGVGKSTFIETLGTWLIAQGHRVAVLAIDPSSRRSGGSILGDKTRMTRLAQSDDAFIRPSPAGTTLGGVARRTRESAQAAEAAGFDIVLIETVGVGQSETAVADMVDVFVLLVSPSGGDELQGIKRGIMELADLVIVTKADGDLKSAAIRTAAEYTSALHLMAPKFQNWMAWVGMVSSPQAEGIDEVWAAISRFKSSLQVTGEWDAQRQAQRLTWFRNELREALLESIGRTPEAKAELKRLEKMVAGGEISPTIAAQTVIGEILAKS